MKKNVFSLRKLALTALVVSLFAFSACNNDGENVNRFKEAAMNLDNTSHTLTDEFDYWPECGIRVTGSHLASLISLNDLQKMLPCPLYTSGPHHDGQWDLESDEDFGHYNPQAIQYLAKLAKKVVADKTFVQASKPLIDKYLYRQMHIMMVLHDAIYDQELYDQDVREYIFQQMIEGQGYGEDAGYLQASLDLDDDSYVYGNISDRFLYFWARRWADGTIDPFYDALSSVFKAYYPEYQFTTEKYWREPEWFEEYYEEEWYGDEGFQETAYNCELEDDMAVTDKERIKERDAVEIIRSAASNLDKTSLVFENEFDYWPECGIRVTGGHLFSLISLRTLNRMLPCDLYVSGPHHYNRWELECPYDYGYYNPEAIRYLGQLAKNVVSDKSFVEKTRPLIDKYLKRQMLIMKGLYEGLNDKSVCDDKQAILSSIRQTQGQAYGTIASGFLGALEPALEDGTYVYGNTGEMFLYWWARRDADGTMELFHEILDTVYSAYYSK